MNKPALLMVVGLVAVVCFAQSDHVPAFNNGNVKPGEAQILPKTEQWGEAFQYPYQAKPLRTGGEDSQRPQPDAVLLLLRAHGT